MVFDLEFCASGARWGENEFSSSSWISAQSCRQAGQRRRCQKDVSTTSLFTAACFAAASPATHRACAEHHPGGAAAAAQRRSQAAEEEGGRRRRPRKQAPLLPPRPPLPRHRPRRWAPTPMPTKAPYKVEQSASGKLTQPLVNTPRTVTATPKEVIEDKSARDLRELARSSRVDHRLGRRRKRLWRIRHSRLQGQQRYFRRQHSQSWQSSSPTYFPSSRWRSTRARAAE